MIRKLIHYCWFGNGPKNKTIRRGMHSWKQNISGYEFCPCIGNFPDNQFSAQSYSGLFIACVCNTSSMLCYLSSCILTVYRKIKV